MPIERPLRLVHVHKMAGVSGSEHHLLQLLPGLRRRGHRVSLVALGREGGLDAAYRASLERAGVEVSRQPLVGDLDPGLMFRLRDLFCRLRPDIVHTHLIHADLHGILAARLAGVPAVVSTKHNDDPFRTRWPIRTVEGFLAARTDRIVCISGWLRRFTLQHVRARRDSVVVIRYGHDDAPQVGSLASSDCDRLREPAPLLLAVGRLVAQKGHAYLLRAFARVVAAVPSARLVIAGEGGLRGRLQRQVRSLGLHGRVSLPGYVNWPTDLMRQCAVFVHPSLWEGFGLAVLEAMAAGTPIVATRVGALPELVRDGREGLLVAPHDDRALADAIVRLLSEPGLGDRLGAAGRARVARHFQVDRMVWLTEQLYDACLGGSGLRAIA